MKNYIDKRGDLISRLQRIATAVFVAGIAGTVAASRMARGINSASNGLATSASSSEILVVKSKVSKQEQAKLVAASMRQTQQLLGELVEQVQKMPELEGHDRELAMKRARTIARSLQVFDRISNIPTIRLKEGVVLNMCAAPGEAAVAFLSTGFNLDIGGKGFLALKLRGNYGMQQFSFLSGTTSTNIINAINSFTKQTGVEASQNEENNQRIQMNSVYIGSESMIFAYIFEGPDILFDQPVGGFGFDDLKDYGKNAITLQAIQDKP